MVKNCCKRLVNLLTNDLADSIISNVGVQLLEYSSWFYFICFWNSELLPFIIPKLKYYLKMYIKFLICVRNMIFYKCNVIKIVLFWICIYVLYIYIYIYGFVCCYGNMLLLSAQHNITMEVIINKFCCYTIKKSLEK